MRILQQKVIWLGLIVFALGVVLMLLGTPGTQAQGTPPPTATPNTQPPTNPENGNNDRNSNTHNNSDDDDDSPPGAYIELQLSNAPPGAWSVVQWQDANGDWLNVEGWQGSLDNGHRLWWVAAKDFGKGPFRWVVFNSPDGPLIAASEPFTLPQFPNETVRVELGE